jgi:hypothetical protein
MGLALVHGDHLALPLTVPHLALLLDLDRLAHQSALPDLEIIDPTLSKSLQWLLDHPLAELGDDLTFSALVNSFHGPAVEVALCPDQPKTAAVTEANKQAYVEALARFHVCSKIRDEVWAPRPSLTQLGTTGADAESCLDLCL